MKRMETLTHECIEKEEGGKGGGGAAALGWLECRSYTAHS